VDTVLLDPEVSALLLQAAGRGLTGAVLGNERSPFAGRHGERVAADLLTVVDDGLSSGGPGGAPVDDEGVPRRRTPLITDGVLVGALHSMATAASMDASSTGNARRSSHKAAPRAAPSVLRLAPSSAGVNVAGEAVYVQQVSGSVAGISAVTGRVSLGGVGYLLRDGEPAGRLPTLPIATSMRSLLAELVAVGDDARVVAGQSLLAPTLVWRPRKPLTW
jgi:predicted Zn-dependent protease